MSKELEALNTIKQARYFIDFELDAKLSEDYKKELDIIETALKILEQLQVIIGAEKIEDLPKLALKTENACYSACYNLKEAEKKLKALEIIKEKKVNLEYLKCWATYEQYKIICSYWNEITQEEYNLLREVLL